MNKEYIETTLYLDDYNNNLAYDLHNLKLKNNMNIPDISNDININVKDKLDSDLIIISEFNRNSITFNNENYIKYKDFFYSPFILVSYNKPDKNCMLINDKNYNSGTYVFTLNFKTLLEAIENDKTCKELCNEDNENSIKLYIPNTNFNYYSKVVDLIMLTLNDFNIPSNEEYDILYKRTLKILNKCETYDNLKILNEEFDGFYLIPEHSILQIKKGYIINPLKTIAIYNDLYINKNLEYQVVIEDILKNNKKIISHLGYRNENMNYSINDINKFSYSDNFLKIEDDNLNLSKKEILENLIQYQYSSIEDFQEKVDNTLNQTVENNESSTEEDEIKDNKNSTQEDELTIKDIFCILLIGFAISLILLNIFY